MSNRLLSSLATFSVGLGAVATAVSYSIYNVDGGQRAVIFDQIFGVKEKPIGEGTHFMIPFIQTPIIMDIRTKARRIESQTGTKDMQTVKVALRVLHHPLEEQLPTIWRKYGLDYDERVLPSIGNEVLKAIVAQFDASELITQRDLVSMKIREELTKRANQFYIIFDDISIVDVTFSREFTQAVEQKQVAQQDAERAKFVVEKAEQEKLAAIIRAEGDSSAAKMISDALHESGQGLIELRRIEASKDIANTLSSSRNVVYLPGGSKAPTMLMNMS